MMVWVIWLSVWIICAFAWKLRCALIMLTSAEVVSTFDSSTEPDWTVPKPELPATPSTAAPEAFVWAQLSYRFVVTENTAEARELERLIRTEGHSGERPLLNPASGRRRP